MHHINVRLFQNSVPRAIFSDKCRLFLKIEDLEKKLSALQIIYRDRTCRLEVLWDFFDVYVFYLRQISFPTLILFLI
jgi:hypothetical protein